MKTVGTDFVAPAHRFCDFVHRARQLPLEERMRNAQRLLIELYVAALELPEVDTLEDPEVASAQHRPDASFDQFDFYWEVFDPYETDNAVAGDLADDIGDIYADLQQGLVFWNSGAAEAAVWHWRFSFHTHWGDHAANALRALHWALKRV